MMFSSGQCKDVTFAPVIGQKYKLIEVSNDLAKNIEGLKLVELKGSDTEEAVLCTSNQTFSLKRVETSNSVFLLPCKGEELCISAVCKDYYELRLMPGKVDQIGNIVKSLSEGSDSDALRKVPCEVLHSTVLASEAEIRAAMEAHHMLLIDGNYLFLPPVAYRTLLQALCHGFLAQGWALHQLDEQMCCEYLKEDFCADSVRYVLCMLGEKDGSHWKLSADKVARATLDLVLSQQPAVTRDNLFVDWCAIAPTGVDCSSTTMSKLLSGLAVDAGDHLAYLPAEEMPAGLQDRFVKLFAVKQRYSAEEMRPYLLPFFGKDGQPKEVEDVLVTHLKYIDGAFLMP